MLLVMKLGIDDLSAAVWDYRPPDKIGRHELTNQQWCLISDLFPRPETRRGKPTHPRKLLDAMFWLLRTGAPWRDLPEERYGPWSTVWKNFDLWRREGRLERVRERLLGVLNEAGEVDWELWCVDGTSIRASRCAAGGGKRGRQTSRRTTHSDGLAAVGARRSTS